MALVSIIMFVVNNTTYLRRFIQNWMQYEKRKEEAKKRCFGEIWLAPIFFPYRLAIMILNRFRRLLSTLSSLVNIFSTAFFKLCSFSSLTAAQIQSSILTDFVGFVRSCGVSVLCVRPCPSIAPLSLINLTQVWKPSSHQIKLTIVNRLFPSGSQTAFNLCMV